MKIENIPQPLVKSLIEIIRSLVRVHSIYWIGATKNDSSSSYLFNSEGRDKFNQQYEFTLLVISYAEIRDPKTFMGEVFNKMKEQVKLYSIHYSYNDIKRRLEAGDNFLSRVLLPGNCLFQESPLSLTGYCYHPRKFEEIKKVWEFRLNRAAYFEDKTDTIDMVNDESARMVLVSQNILQTCTAIIWVYWEWKPHYFELDLLLNLCKNFSKSPRIVLPKKSFTSKKVYSQLCHAQYNSNFKTVDDVSMEDSDYASKLAERFLRSVRKEGNKKLKELELLHNAEIKNDT